MRVQRTFPADPHSVPAARRFAVQALSETALDVRQSVELMVSELVTNGIRHGQTSFDLVIALTADEIRVEVTDHGGGTPEMRFPGPDEPTGRGLQIVGMLSEEWGVESSGAAGKTVWFILSAAAKEAKTDDEAARQFRSGGRTRAPSEPTAWTFQLRGTPALG